MVALAEAFVRIRPDTRQFRPEAERGINADSRRMGSTGGGLFSRAFGDAARSGLGRAGRDAAAGFADGFTRDALGRFRSAAGGFDGAGRDAGGRFADGFVRDATGRLRDARGRFSSEGRGIGGALSEGVGGGARAGVLGVQTLVGVGAAIAPAIVPAAAAAAAALAALGPAAVAGVAGIGVLALGLSGIGEAVGALDAAQKDAQKSAASLSSSQAAVASAADGVRSAEAALGNTRAQVAEATHRAAERVTDAQEELTRAERDARDVVRELDEARKQATRRLADQQASVRENALSQRQANLDVAEAKRDLDKILRDPRATAEQREQARITYARQVEQLGELRRRGKELAADQAAASRAGVEGSREVRAAKDRIADADARVGRAQKAVADARREQQNQQRQGAYQVAQAVQAVAAAQRGLAQASVRAGVAGGAAMDKLKEAMDNLSPAGQKFARFLFGLKGELGDLRAAAAGGLLPGLQTAIETLLPFLPQIRGFLSRFGALIGEIAVKAAKAFTSPFWREFFGFIEKTGVPAFVELGRAGLSVAEGIAALVRAFGPLTGDVSTGIADLARRFAAWAKELPKSKGFQEFLAYVREQGPTVLRLVGDLLVVALKLVVGLAPLGAVVAKGLGKLAGWLAKLDPGVLLGIAAAVTAIVATIITLAAGPVAAIGAIVVGTIAFVAAIVYAYTKVKWFRDFVDKSWQVIAATATWLWQKVLLPAFTAWRWYMQTVLGPAAVWLWQRVLKPAFVGIGAAVEFAWTRVIKPALGFLVLWLTKVVAPAMSWLWERVVKPAWAGISLVVKVAWALMKVVFGLIQIGLKILGAAFMWLWTNVIGPVWGWIYSKAIAPAWARIKPVLAALGDFIRTRVAPAFTAGVTAIGKAWDRIKAIAMVPVRFIVDTVINKGIIGTYNKLADYFGVDTITPIVWTPNTAAATKPVFHGLATGGVLPGYSPGRDIHQFVSPTGGALALSGGEAVMRPEFTRAVGGGFVDTANRAARTGGVGAVRSLLGGLLNTVGGDSSSPASGYVSRTGGVGRRAFASGGVIGFLRDTWDQASDPSGTVRRLIGETIERIPGGPAAKRTASGVARRVLDNLIRWVGRMFGGAGGGTGKVADIQAWLRRQAGKPYQWAAAGPDGYDCSGLVSAVYNMLQGRSPYSHTFSTHFMDQYFTKPGPGLFTAGWAHAGERGGGSVGHTAGRLAGLPFESRGGDGVVIGPRATPVTAFARLAHYALGGVLDRVPVFDSGGVLAPGLNVVDNRTGAYEHLVPAGRGGGGAIHLHFHGPVGSQRELDSWLIKAKRRLENERRW